MYIYIYRLCLYMMRFTLHTLRFPPPCTYATPTRTFFVFLFKPFYFHFQYNITGFKACLIILVTMQSVQTFQKRKTREDR